MEDQLSAAHRDVDAGAIADVADVEPHVSRRHQGGPHLVLLGLIPAQDADLRAVAVEQVMHNRRPEGTGTACNEDRLACVASVHHDLDPSASRSEV